MSVEALPQPALSDEQMATVIPALSRTQRRVYEAIRAYVTENGYSPTLREIAAATGQAFSTVDYQVRQLAEKGWLRRHPNRPRALVLLDPEGVQ